MPESSEQNAQLLSLAQGSSGNTTGAAAGASSTTSSSTTSETTSRQQDTNQSGSEGSISTGDVSAKTSGGGGGGGGGGSGGAGSYGLSFATGPEITSSGLHGAVDLGDRSTRGGANFGAFTVTSRGSQSSVAQGAQSQDQTAMHGITSLPTWAKWAGGAAIVAVLGGITWYAVRK